MEGSSGRGGVFGKGREGDVLRRSAPLNPSPAYFISEGGRVGRYLTVYKYKPALESCRLDRLFPRGVPGPRERASKDTMH